MQYFRDGLDFITVLSHSEIGPVAELLRCAITQRTCPPKNALTEVCTSLGNCSYL